MLDSVYADISQAIGVNVSSELDIYRLVSAGITPEVYFAASRFLRLPRGLVTKRRFKPETRGARRLSLDESERLVRVARTYADAVAMFGDREAALRWLSTPRNFVHGMPSMSPIELSMSEVGERLITSKIARTSHGIF